MASPTDLSSLRNQSQRAPPHGPMDDDWRARWPLRQARAFWSLVRPPLLRYREIAPAAGLLYAVWKRRQWQRQAELAAKAVREGRFMEQCSLLLVNVEGLLKGANLSATVSIQTLFTRTLRSLMFDNEKMVELVSEAGGGWGCSSRKAPTANLFKGAFWYVMSLPYDDPSPVADSPERLHQQTRALKRRQREPPACRLSWSSAATAGWSWPTSTPT